MIKGKRIVSSKSLTRELARTIGFAAFTTLLAGYVPHAMAQEQGQRTFHSTEEAGSALFAAAQSENEKALIDILGAAGKEVISSGDAAEDMNERVGFVVKYQEMHRYRKEAEGASVLHVGAENWPFPIPLVNKNGVWYFDTDAGKQEILMRRIGKNELAAMDACHQLVEAEKEYYKKPFSGEDHYTQRFISDKGKHDGLYWTEAANEFDSFLDPLIASAGQDDRKSASDLSAGGPIPFNGYYFRVLTAQGANAPGGAENYMVNGKMVKGFAFVAYPAEYRSSGVVTFIANETGVVYEKDLGPDTKEIASSMTEYNPDSTWRRAE